MTGLSVEELLARVARRDMPAWLGRLDHLCLFIDNLHAHIREEHLQYFRWKVKERRSSEGPPLDPQLYVRAKY
jgi:hypothetical protein